jgi:hypothetical protein
VNSLKAFKQAQWLFNGNCVQVNRLNGANSVWDCLSEEGSLGVLKYYPRDEHGRLHFQSEVEMLTLNQSDYLTQLIWSDPHERCAAFEYADSDVSTPVALSSILNMLENQLPSFSIPDTVHHDAPGILAWWRDGSPDFGPSQQALLHFVRTQEWFEESGTVLEKSWTKDVPLHGDMKLSNLRLGPNGFKVIDWEIIGYGIRGWDSAGLIQSCIAELLVDGDFAPWIRRNQMALSDWLQSADKLLRYALSFRLVQTAIESASRQVPAPLHAAGLIQLASDSAAGNFERILSL